MLSKKKTPARVSFLSDYLQDMVMRILQKESVMRVLI